MTPRRSPRLASLAPGRRSNRSPDLAPPRPVTPRAQAPQLPRHVGQRNQAHRSQPTQTATRNGSLETPSNANASNIPSAECQGGGPSGGITGDAPPIRSSSDATIRMHESTVSGFDENLQHAPWQTPDSAWATEHAAEEMSRRASSIFQFPQTPAAPHLSEVATLPIGGKPSRKNITLDLFNGAVAPEAFDSGVRRWWKKFMDQLNDAQIIDRHQWSDIQCRSIFAASLAGDAADWYSDLRALRSNLTLDLVGELLVEKYKTKIPEQELMSRLMAEPKRRQETYQEYAQRLLNIADSLPGGVSTEANARQALHTFIKRAYYKYSDELKSYVGRLPSSIPAVQKLQQLVDHLSYMAESDGRLPPKATQSERVVSSAKRIKLERGGHATGSATAKSTIVEHKRKKNYRADRPRFANTEPIRAEGPRCFDYKQLGHIARDCPDRQDQESTRSRIQGSAAAALREDIA